MKEPLSSNLVADLRTMCECSGLSNPAGICHTCQAADEIDRLTASFDAAKHEWEIAAGERDRLAARVAELEAESLQWEKESLCKLIAERDRLTAELEEFKQYHREDGIDKLLADRDRLRAALAGEIGLVQLLSARSELQPDRQTVLSNHRHVEALAALGDWQPDETDDGH